MENILSLKAKDLRQNPTETEILLWKYLRSRRLHDLKFRRQHRIGRFIVDFVCFDRRLIVELDGEPHKTQVERDAERDAWLEGQGFKVVRFWNDEVTHNLEHVLDKILTAAALTPSPFHGRGAGGEGL